MISLFDPMIIASVAWHQFEILCFQGTEKWIIVSWELLCSERQQRFSTTLKIFEKSFTRRTPLNLWIVWLEKRYKTGKYFRMTIHPWS